MNPGKQNKLRALLGLLFILLFPLYEPLNIPRQRLHDMGTLIDGHIPVVPAFVIPYVSLYPYLVVSIGLLALKGKKGRLEEFLMAGSVTMIAAYLAYGFFQTYVPRPALTGTDFFTAVLHTVYNSDQPYNAFPSLHAGFSILAALSLDRKVPGYKAFVVWGILIAVSTVFVKQHYVLDVLGGGLLAAVSLYLAHTGLAFLKTDQQQD